MKNAFKYVWALDVGESTLKAMKFRPSDDPTTLNVEAFEFVEYAKENHRPFFDPDIRVSRTLRGFRERHDMKVCKVIVGVSGRAGLVKFIKAPSVSRAKLDEIIKFEKRQSVPFPLEDLCFDSAIISDRNTGIVEEVGVFALRRQNIWQVTEPLKNAGIEVDIVQLAPIAMFNFAVFEHFKNAPGHGPVVFLDIGMEGTDLIISDGIRFWQRNVPVGGSHFSRALAADSGITPFEAEQAKRNASSGENIEAMRTAFEEFVGEVARSISFYTSVNRHAAVEEIVVMGGGLKLAGLSSYLEANLKWPVRQVDSINSLRGEAVTCAVEFQTNVRSFALCIGMGLQGLGRAAIDTNLLPPEWRPIRGWSPTAIRERLKRLLPK